MVYFKQNGGTKTDLINGYTNNMEPQTSSIEVKLNTHGRYTWKINVNYTEDYKEAVKELKAIDGLLKEEFPEYTKKASGRVSNIDEYGS